MSLVGTESFHDDDDDDDEIRSILIFFFLEFYQFQILDT